MSVFPRRIRLVTFDAMKTLISPREPIGKTYSDFARRYYEISIDSRLLNEAFLSAYRQKDQVRPCFGFFESDNPETNSSLIDIQRRWWISVVERTFSKCSDEIDSDKLRRLSSDLYEYFGTTEPWQLDSSAKIILNILTRKGISVAILSNFDSRLRKIISEFGLGSNFRAFFLSGETGLAKPNEKLYRLVEKTLLVYSDEIAHIGDDLEKDYLPAKSVGWRAFLYMHSGDNDLDSRVDSNDVVRDFIELKSKVF